MYKLAFLFLSFFLVPEGNSQDCITFHSDFSGIEWDETERTLITTAACDLKTLVADAGVIGFKVHTFGFYGYNANMEGGTEAVWNDFLSSKVNTATPHLAIGKEINLDGSFKKFWVSFNVPTSGYFNCMSTSDRNALKSQLETFGSSGSPNPSALGMLNWLKAKLIKVKNCCEVATGTLTCSDCQYSLAEAEAKLIEKGFYKIEAENIAVTPHVYTTFQSNIKIKFNANGNLVNLTDELESFLSEINGTAKVTRFSNSNCQGLANFVDVDMHIFDYGEDIVLLDFDDKKVLYTKYTSLCINNGKRVLPIVIWALRKAGQIAAGVVIDLGIEVLIEKWVGGHSSFYDAFIATDLGCSEVASAIGDNTFKSKIGGFIWEASKPAVSYVIETPSAQWSWNGMGTKVEAGIQDALMNELVGKFLGKFKKSFSKHPSIKNTIEVNAIASDLVEVVKKDPKRLRSLKTFAVYWKYLYLNKNPISKKLRHNPNVIDYIKNCQIAKVGAKFSNKDNFSKDFKNKFPEIPSSEIRAVHHGVEQQVLTKYPGLFTYDEIHSFENLRGIPEFQPDFKKDFHLSDIRIEWNDFYETFSGNNKPTKQDVLNKVKQIEDKFGKYFLPPTR